MKIKVVFCLGFLLLLFSASAFSQRPAMSTLPVLRDGRDNPDFKDFYKIGETTGNIGGAKAILLPKPTFPIEAREAGAEGRVKVEITIDESGSVSAAKAVSGHPALYEAAEKAARQSKFSVPKAGGAGTQVSGFISYNFLIETPNWFKVGYDVAVIEKLPTLGFFQIPIIKKAIQPDWQTENDLLAQLKWMRDEEKKAFGDAPVEKPVFVNKSGKTSASQSVSMRLNIPPPNPQKISASQNLITALQARLANDEISLWQFNLGLAFIKAQGSLRNPATRQDVVGILKPFIDTAPNGVPAEYVENLKNFVNLFENQSSGSFDDKASTDMRTEIGKIIANMQKLK